MKKKRERLTRLTPLRQVSIVLIAVFLCLAVSHAWYYVLPFSSALNLFMLSETKYSEIATEDRHRYVALCFLFVGATLVGTGVALHYITKREEL